MAGPTSFDKSQKEPRVIVALDPPTPENVAPIGTFWVATATEIATLWACVAQGLGGTTSVWRSV